MIRINLIPREERVTTRPAGPNWTLIAGAIAPVIYGLILSALVAYQNHESVVLDELINQEETALTHYGPALEKIDQLTKERAEVQNRLDAMESLDRSRRLPVRLLETVNRSVPRYLWIDRVEDTDGAGIEMSIKGKTFSNLIVSDFIERLEETELFRVVDLEIAKETRIGETKVIEFSLVVQGVENAPTEADDKVAGVAASVEGG